METLTLVFEHLDPLIICCSIFLVSKALLSVIQFLLRIGFELDCDSKRIKKIAEKLGIKDGDEK